MSPLSVEKLLARSVSRTHTLPPNSLQLSVTTTLPTLTITKTPVNTDKDCAGGASQESNIARDTVNRSGPQRSQSRSTAFPEDGRKTCTTLFPIARRSRNFK